MAAKTSNLNGTEERPNRRERRERNEGGAREKEKSQFIERVVFINRVAKVVKGGRRFAFTALVVVGDGNGMVGIGYGKAREVPQAIQKAVEEAKKSFFKVPRVQGTIPHPITGEAAAGIVMLRPAKSVLMTSVIDVIVKRMRLKNEKTVILSSMEYNIIMLIRMVARK